MERGFKYRIYPNESQRDQIARTLGCCRFVYNRALDVKKSAYAKTGKTVSWAELSRMLPAWKRDPATSWLAQADSMALQQSIRDLDRAYKNFFRRVREGGKPGFPKFKSPARPAVLPHQRRQDRRPQPYRAAEAWDCPGQGITTAPGAFHVGHGLPGRGRLLLRHLPLHRRAG